MLIPDSITAFITDGSLAQLCATAEGVIGAPVALRDRIGAVVEAPGGDRGARRSHDFGGYAATIRIGDTVIGSLALGDEDTLTDDQRDDARRFVTLLASIVSELCEREVELRRHIERLGAMKMVASTLVSAGGVQETIDVGLQSAIELIGADAGTLRLLDGSGRMLLLRAASGLSEEYLDEAGPLPADNALDRETLAGHVVAVTEFTEEDHINHPHAVKAEHLVSMLSTALMFQGEPLGVLRVYTRTRRDFSDAERDLFRSIARQIAAAVANANLLYREARTEAVRQQVRLAGDVQRRMLPRELPQVPPAEFGAVCHSSFDVGGDFYDVFRAGGGAGFLVGDVVGKGVAAALLMANLHGALRAFAEGSDDPATVLSSTNRALSRDSLPSEFATVFYGVVDPATGRLAYCNGGHEPPLIVRVPEHRAPNRSDVDELDIGGMVIGVDPSQRYQTGLCELHPGDVLLAFSDGVTEAMDFDMKKFGRERVREELLSFLSEEPGASAECIAKHLHWAVRRYTGLAEQSDDITILAVRMNAANEAGA